jgi:hypothetical protein
MDTIKKKRSCIPNLLNYCVIFIVYAEFTNVAVGLIIQSRGPHATNGPRDETRVLNTGCDASVLSSFEIFRCLLKLK